MLDITTNMKILVFVLILFIEYYFDFTIIELVIKYVNKIIMEFKFYYIS
jgi:hypothetical protein